MIDLDALKRAMEGTEIATLVSNEDLEALIAEARAGRSARAALVHIKNLDPTIYGWTMGCVAEKAVKDYDTAVKREPHAEG